MTNASRRIVYWLPRWLSIAFIAFLSLFALDVFEMELGFWQTALALAIHLVPSALLTVAVVVAWRWEWIGAVMFGGAAAFYVYQVVPNTHLPVMARIVWPLTIAGPALAIAALFLVNWLHHDELRRRAA